MTSSAAEKMCYASGAESEAEEATDVEALGNEDGTEQEMPFSKRKLECSSTSTSSAEEPTIKRKLSDNRRIKLEKPLSSQQRDQLMVQVAKDELESKKRHIDILEQSTKGIEKMSETMAQSSNSLGQQRGNGLLYLAQAMSTNQGYQHQYPPYSFGHPTQQQQQQQHIPTPYTTLLNNFPIPHTEGDEDKSNSE